MGRARVDLVTDEWPAYNGLDRHFISHSRINHSAGIYVQGDTHTNTVEGFLGISKRASRGNYKKVSHKWLQGYLNEFTWRYNHRNSGESMFHLLVNRAGQAIEPDAKRCSQARWRATGS